VNSLCQLHFLYKKRNYHQSNGNAPSTYSLFEIENDQVENDSTPQVKNNNTYQVKIDSRDQVINDSTVEVKKHIGVGVKTNSTLEVETDTYTTKAKTILAQTKESYNTTGWSDEIFAYFFKKLKLKHGQPRLEKEYATFCQLPKTVLDIENQKKIVDRFVNDHQDTHSFSRFLSYCAPYVRAVESELENIQLRAQNQKLLEKSQKEIMRQKSDRIDSENEKYAKFQALPELERKRLLKGHGAGWQSEKARWRMYSQTVKKQKPKKASEHNVTPITKDIQQTLLF
ncbi:MAG: hypothetical protein KDK51_00775, partial [Deltaproteobacteria bacterium]|nr:hypothetical protein [Deltaproteobacteria bacterium]